MNYSDILISLFLCVGSICRCAYLDCSFLQWLWRMGFLSPLGFLFWGDVLLTAPGQSRPVCWGVLSAAQLLHFKCLRALAELSSVLLLSRSLNLKLSTSHPAHLIVTPVSMWAAGGEMTSLIESYYQSVQSDCRETVHQDSDEEDDGNNDSQDESLSQSTSSTSASVSSNSVRFLIIIQHQLIYWLSCNIAYSADRLTLIYLCLSIHPWQCQCQWDQLFNIYSFLLPPVPGPHPRVRVPLSPRHHDGGRPGAGAEQLLRRAPHGVVSPLPELPRLLGPVR